MGTPHCEVGEPRMVDERLRVIFIFVQGGEVVYSAGW
jgi:hypothetical protein